MERTRESLAWAAGFFDGEGCFSTHSGAHGTPVATISQQHPELLQKFLDVVALPGFTYYELRNSTRPHQNSMYQLHITGFEWVQALLAMLWPWLGDVKRAKGIAVLQHYHSLPIKRRRSRRVEKGK